MKNFKNFPIFWIFYREDIISKKILPSPRVGSGPVVLSLVVKRQDLYRLSHGKGRYVRATTVEHHIQYMLPQPEIPNPGEVNEKRCPTIGTVNQIFLKNSLMKFLI